MSVHQQVEFLIRRAERRQQLLQVRDVDAGANALTAEQAAKADRCRSDFGFWCENYVYIEDKQSHGPVLLKMYECQKQIAELLVKREWLWILKARRLGMSWLIVAFAVWLVTFHSSRTIVIVLQTEPYAIEALERARYIINAMPAWMRPKLGRDADAQIFIPSTNGRLQVVACTREAIHSMAADLVILDEAARHRYLREIRAAAQPAVETAAGGQIVAISTSAGPGGEFYDTWTAASSGRSRFKPVFFNWRARPGRDDAWYEREKLENEANPLYMPQQYPMSAEEAFQSAEGRVYPLFIRSDKFIRSIVLTDEAAKRWRRYRSIDFGGVDPFVCLWACVVPGDGPGLTVDPSCGNTIREMLGYGYDKGKPADHDNHACDALRYLITTPGLEGLKGHVHIYRELYEPNSAARGFGVDDLVRRIITMSTGEAFELSVADCSRPDLIRTFSNMGIAPIQGQRKLGGNVDGEIEQGIVQVNALIVAQAKSKAVAIPDRNYAPMYFQPYDKQNRDRQPPRPPIFG